MKDRLLAFPWMIVFLRAFIDYQCYLMVVNPTVGIALLTIFDVFMILLTYREYAKRRVMRSA